MSNIENAKAISSTDNGWTSLEKDNETAGDNDGGWSNLVEVQMDFGVPDGWVRMAEEYNISRQDKENGLDRILYTARDRAATAISQLLSEVGADTHQYRYINQIPVGLEQDSDVPGVYDPGIYSVVIGKESDEVLDFLDEEISAEVCEKRLARTMAHEMIHALQTVPSDIARDSYVTVGDAVKGWSGLEEGMAEALAYIANVMQSSGRSLEEASLYCADRLKDADAPATYISAELVAKMPPELLNWYLTVSSHRDYQDGGEMREFLDDNYEKFLNNLNLLYRYEEDSIDLDDTVKARLVAESRQMIDGAAERGEMVA